MAEHGIVDRVTAFCRVLRERGLVVTPAESVDAVRMLEWIDLTDRAEMHLALRSLLATRQEDLVAFDAAFADWWRVAEPEENSSRDRANTPKTRLGKPDEKKRGDVGAVTLSRWSSSSVVADDDAPTPLAMPSANESRAKKDFATFDADELDEIERLTRAIARRINARRSRRWKPAARGSSSRVDLRRTIRLSLKTGGDIVELARRERKLRRTKLVALCDVSGSMDLYSRFLLQLLYALQHAFARVETFVFSTRLVPISEALRRDEYRAALTALARAETGWSGGTKIGASIAQFVADWSRLIDRRTVVIILSDGWDTGEPELLGNAMREIHRRAGRVLWLNPLLGSLSYKPLTRGMQAALPHVDVFASAHNVASLAELGRHLAI
jgi:uncharacterized protein